MNPKNKNHLAAFTKLLTSFLGLRLIMALLFVAFMAVAVDTQAQGFQSRSFLGDGITNVLIVNGALPAGTTVAVATNSYAGYTNATLVIQTGTNIFGTNANFMKAGVGYSNAPAIRDVSLWANRDGSVPVANINVRMRGVNAAFTNALLFTFAPVPKNDGIAATTGTFSFTVNGNGANLVDVPTNVPTAFLQNCAGGVRLVSATPSNAGTNGALLDVSINGFIPTP
jgi:hypothetical protein